MTMTMMPSAKVLALVLALVPAGNAALAATPTPVPGGANMTAGVTGTMSQVLFNGKLRLKSMKLREAVEADREPALANGRAVVFQAVVSNGTQHSIHGYFNAALADADGITVNGRPLDDGWDLEPGTAARSAYGFQIPSDFKPVRLVLIEAADPKAKAFRVTIKPTDFPAAS
jgi:hypothetical protein